MPTQTAVWHIAADVDTLFLCLAKVFPYMNQFEALGQPRPKLLDYQPSPGRCLVKIPDDTSGYICHGS